MENGNLVVIFYFPYLIYKTAKRLENGNLVEVFYLYLRHIIDLMVKPSKPVGGAHAHTMRSHIMKGQRVRWVHDLWIVNLLHNLENVYIAEMRPMVEDSYTHEQVSEFLSVQELRQSCSKESNYSWTMFNCNYSPLIDCSSEYYAHSKTFLHFRLKTHVLHSCIAAEHSDSRRVVCTYCDYAPFAQSLQFMVQTTI